MNTKITSTLILLAGLMPSTALAYVSPEEVLLNRELFMPPSAREANDRSILQAEESAARRTREQDAAFALQHPIEEELYDEFEDEELFGSAPQYPQGGFFAYPVPVQGGGFYGQPSLFGAAPSVNGTEAANMELLRTVRLLNRVNQNQAVSGIQGQYMMQHGQSLHAGAPLAPTGAPALICAGTMLAATAWTMRRAKKAKKVVTF